MPRLNRRSNNILALIDTKKLLQLVQENQFLYDPSHPYYNNVEKTEEAWHEIGGNFGPHGRTKLAKMKWNHCWDVYDMFLKNKTKHISYAAEIKFVKPYLEKLRENKKPAKYEKYKMKNKVPYVKPTPEQTEGRAKDDSHDKITTTKHDVTNYTSETKFVKRQRGRPRKNKEITNYEENEDRENLSPVPTTEQSQIQAQDGNHSEVTKTGYNVNNCALETTLVKRLRSRPRKNKGIANYEQNEDRGNVFPVPTTEHTQIQAQVGNHSEVTKTGYNVNNCALETTFVKRLRGRPRKNKEITNYEQNDRENVFPVPTTEQTQIQAQDGNHSEVTKTRYNVNNCALETTLVKRLRGRPRKNKGITNYKKNEDRENVSPVPTTEQTQIQAQDGHRSNVTGYNNNNCTLESEFVKLHLKRPRGDQKQFNNHEKNKIKKNVIFAKRVVEQNRNISENKSHGEITTECNVKADVSKTEQRHKRLTEEEEEKKKKKQNMISAKQIAEQNEIIPEEESQSEIILNKIIKPHFKRLGEHKDFANNKTEDNEEGVLSVKVTADESQAQDDSDSKITTTEYKVNICASEKESAELYLRRSKEDEKIAHHEKNEKKNDVPYVEATAEQTRIKTEDNNLNYTDDELKETTSSAHSNYTNDVLAETSAILEETSTYKTEPLDENDLIFLKYARTIKKLPTSQQNVLKLKFAKLKDNEEGVLSVKVTADESQAEDDSDSKITTTEYKVNICASEKESAELYLRRSKEDEKIAHHEKNEKKNDVPYVEATAEQTRIKTEDNNLNYTDDELKETTSSAHSNYTNDVLAETSAILEETSTYKTDPLDENDLIFLKYARTIKKLPTSQQNVLKLKFAKLVMEVETELDGKSTATESVQK